VTISRGLVSTDYIEELYKRQAFSGKIVIRIGESPPVSFDPILPPDDKKPGRRYLPGFVNESIELR
jgi:hypothetical protein